MNALGRQGPAQPRASRSSHAFRWCAGAVGVLLAAITMIGATATEAAPRVQPVSYAAGIAVKQVAVADVALKRVVVKRVAVRKVALKKPAEHSQPEKSRILWGAWIGNAFDTEAAPWDMSPLETFTREVHKAPSIVHFYQDFETCSPACTLAPFPAQYFTAIRQDGSIPMLSWASMATSEGVDASRLSLRSIVSGRLDTYLRTFARAAKQWGHPFFLRFDWEMNVGVGGFPWGVTMPGNSPAEYVAAWRHVHDVFASVGAHNVTWVWCPTATNGAQVSPSEYPGNAYVNWTCLDGYNWGTVPGPSSAWGGWSTFSQIYQASYDAVRKIAPTKPVMVGEFGSTEDGGSKAAWLRNALATIPSEFPAIRAVVYFDDYSGGMDWPLNSSASAMRAFRSGIANPVFSTNTFAHLNGDRPIR